MNNWWEHYVVLQSSDDRYVYFQRNRIALSDDASFIKNTSLAWQMGLPWKEGQTSDHKVNADFNVLLAWKGFIEENIRTWDSSMEPNLTKFALEYFCYDLLRALKKEPICPEQDFYNEYTWGVISYGDEFNTQNPNKVIQAPLGWRIRGPAYHRRGGYLWVVRDPRSASL
jgi:hypothetical protein